jgi:S-adenosylmethionine hydrolase
VHRPLVALLTDYGAGSEYVGALHLAITGRCPAADRIDLAHDVPAGDVAWGALLLAWLLPLAPPSVTVAVVDPGVGTERRGIALACAGGRFLVGPDNGLLAPAARALGLDAAVELRSEAHRLHPVAPTFHGLGVFAPAAAHLACGGALGDLGPGVEPTSLVEPALPAAGAAPGRVETAVIARDRFGNLALAGGADELAAAGLEPGTRVAVAVAGRRQFARVERVFADAPAGGLLVHVDSHGLIAVAVNGGSAAERLGGGPGARVVLEAAAPGGNGG